MNNITISWSGHTRSGMNLHSCTVCQMVSHFVSGGKKGVMQISPLFLPSRSRKGRGRAPLPSSARSLGMGSNSPPNHGCRRRHRRNGTLSLAFPCPFSNGSNKTGEELPYYVPDFYPIAGSFNATRRRRGGEFPLSIHMQQYLSSSDVEGSIAFCSLLEFEPPLPSSSPFTYSKAFWVHGFACLQG